MFRLARFGLLLLLVVALSCNTAIAGDTTEAKVNIPVSEKCETGAEECANQDIKPPLITKEELEK
jgi:hypothetical protein